MEQKNLQLVLAGTSLVAVLFLIGLQIAGAEHATKTESALFNTLQFLLSVAFSWILSRHSSESQFVESQKRFAIAAFRRIKEIERAIARAQRLISTPRSSAHRGDHYSLQPVMTSLLSAQDAVNSSIADWGDIIGDEIHITNEIERLKGLRKSADKFEREYLDNLRVSEEKVDRDILPQLDKLKDSLPPSLKVEDEKSDLEKIYNEATQTLESQFESTGAISFDGFWEPDDSFSCDLDGLKVGDTIYIARGYTTSRSNVLLAFRDQGRWLGVITNTFAELGMDYDSFVEFIGQYLDCTFVPPQFGGNLVPVTLTEIQDKDSNGYWRFSVALNKETVRAPERDA